MSTLIILGLLAIICSATVIPPARSSVAECLMCEIAVRVAAPDLGKDTQEIEKDFDKECKKELKLPFADKKCENYVNEHLDPIIKELESGTAPKDVCVKLHGC
ncbi:surfactant protein B [Oesophagostomum dentatum]|uniref:Surfactant protein B n=1 Tax=Oesophagostomum dentatum TaxID=61180 RepID=A0A0B1TM12_OESDE|nr:surfactant protein B [Oesophagostomum dentatum]